MSVYIVPAWLQQDQVVIVLSKYTSPDQLQVVLPELVLLLVIYHKDCTTMLLVCIRWLN